MKRDNETSWYLSLAVVLSTLTQLAAAILAEKLLRAWNQLGLPSTATGFLGHLQALATGPGMTEPSAAMNSTQKQLQNKHRWSSHQVQQMRGRTFINLITGVSTSRDILSTH